MPDKPELLAPAGSIESFIAALDAGADAVYCGLTEFSARAKAKNFTLAEIAQMTVYAHQKGRRLYLACNTLIKEVELPRLIDILAGLAAIGVDALIIQDVGLGRLASRFFPDLPLHASTQMTIHNSAGVNQLEKMGFSRAVLARELTLDEIAAIRARTTLELEHFVHGALCFSISGQCLFSSYLSGASGNRGRCAQPCRRLYNLSDRPGYFFSTSDLCAIDLLPQLAAAGVTSFKIEGRMKNAEYVARVVAAYRLMLDASAADRKKALAAAREELQQSFGRAATHGFLTGYVPGDLARPGRHGTLGRALGRITRVAGGSIFFKTDEKLHVGDRLRILPKNDQTGTGCTVLNLSVAGRPVKAAAAGDTVQVGIPAGAGIQADDAVYKAGGSQAFTLSIEACQRRLAAARPAPLPVRLHCSLRDDLFTVSVTATGSSRTITYPISSIPATQNPLNAETLRKVFSRTGNTPFSLANLQVGELAPVVIAPARLKEVRRDFYGRLHDELNAARTAADKERRSLAQAALLPPQPTAGSTAAPEITVAISSPADLVLLDEPLVSRVLLACTPDNVRGIERLPDHWKSRLIWDIPCLIFEREWTDYRLGIKKLRNLGFACFRLNNPGHLPLFAGRENLRLAAGDRLPVLNSQAALAWREQGISEFFLPLENDRQNLADLLSRPWDRPLVVTVYGRVVVLLSRIPVRGVKPGSTLRSAKGEIFRLDRIDDLTVVSATTDFSLLGRLAELRAMGAGRLLVDLAHCGGPFSARGREVLTALETDTPQADTTLFNFDRGLA